MYTIIVQRFIDYGLRVGCSVSQLISVTIFLGGNTNESLSGRCWRLRAKPRWKRLQVAIDRAFKWWRPHHCENAYYADLTRARLIISSADVKRFDMA